MTNLARLAPLARGDRIAGGVIHALRRAPGAIQIVVAFSDGEVTFVLDAAARPGPFATLPALSYRTTPVAFATFSAAGESLARILVAHLPRLLNPTWRDRIDELGDDPEASIRLADGLPAEELARVPCTSPWVRLEYGRAEKYGPCCSDFQVAPATSRAPPLELWRSSAMRAFRRSLARPDPSETCRPTCPRLAGRSDTLAYFVARGGPASFRANQIAAIDSILAGADEPAATPLELVFPATSYCNYDCLMCTHGAEGTLADERGPEFYAQVAPLLPGMSRIEVLGGEPLASPVFRDVLAGPLLEAWPHVGVALTTNGSYLTECELARYAHVRFEHLMISLNAATPATYAIVNRGLAWSRIRANLDAVLAARQRARPAFAVTYSMVILRANVHEIEAFAALAEADGVDVRFMLPVRDRNGQSIMLDAGCLAATERALTAVVDRLRARGSHRSAARAEGELAVVRSRRARGVLQVLPDRDG